MVSKRLTICWVAVLAAMLVSAAGWVFSAAAQTRGAQTRAASAAAGGTIGSSITEESLNGSAAATESDEE